MTTRADDMATDADQPKPARGGPGPKPGANDELMPTVLSVTMAVGARLLASKEAIVTRFSAIEELAGVDVLCADKAERERE